MANSDNDNRSGSGTPEMMRFKRSRRRRTPIPAGQARRQGTIATLAFTSLKDKDTALAFLNQHSEALGGRPLELAMASEEGFQKISAAIRERADRDKR